MGISDTVRPRLSPWWRLRREILGGWIARGLVKGRPGRALKTDLFDEASGPYHHAGDLSAPGDFVGLDKDPGVVRRAKARLGMSASCVIGDVRHLPFAAGVFPVVVSLSTLDHFEHVEDIGASLRELARVQSSGGRLLLTLDNPANPEVGLRRLLPGFVLRRLRADTFFVGETVDAQEGRILLEESGYTVERIEYLIHVIRYPAIRVLQWLERGRLVGLLAAAERVVLAVEGLGRLPTRVLTGHYLAWVARKSRDRGQGQGTVNIEQ